MVRRDPGLERLTILAMSVFFVLVGALTIVGAVFVGREISARSRDRKERKRQFEVDGVAM